MTPHIVVTGGIATGKSTVAKMIIEILPHFKLFSFDEYTVELYKNPEIKTFLLTFFGTTNKKEISKIVFNDEHQLSVLNEKFLPHVVEKFNQLIASDVRHVIEFPLYFNVLETNLICSRNGKNYSVLKILCDPNKQINRLSKRDCISIKDAERIIECQRKSPGLDMEYDDYFYTDSDNINKVDQIKDLLLHLEYASRPRMYHTSNHIFNLLDEAKIHKSSINFPRAVDLAIKFHDVVYETSKELYPINESESCKTMRIYCRSDDSINEDDLIFAEKMIMATKDHNPYVVGLTEKELSDMKLFLDFDMKILGTTHPEVINTYESNIREEFSIYSDQEYIQGRIEVLSNLLKRPVIFHSDQYSHMNDQAKKNLEYLITNLEAQL